MTCLEEVVAAVADSAASPGRKREILDELKLDAFLIVFSAIEGLLRRQQLEREDRRYDDELARALRSARRTRGHVSLNALVDAWKKATGKGQDIAPFIDFIKLRDWLAHGRAWDQPKNVLPDSRKLFKVAVELSQAVQHWPDPRI